MKPTVPDILEKGRVAETGQYPTTDRGEWYGRFIVKAPTGAYLMLVVSLGEPDDWESFGWPLPAFDHVSVSVRLQERCPTWEEMAWVKSLCWSPDECVIQYHPPESQYVNHHPYCLHLWKPVGVELPQPPSITVGPQRVTESNA